METEKLEIININWRYTFVENIVPTIFNILILCGFVSGIHYINRLEQSDINVFALIAVLVIMFKFFKLNFTIVYNLKDGTKYIR